MIESSSRAFMYGESVITTMRMVDGQVRDWELHFHRLMKGVEFIYGPFTEEDWQNRLRPQLEASWMNLKGSKVLRLAIHREQERGLRPSGSVSISDLKIELTSSELTAAATTSVALRTCPAPVRPVWWPGYLKAGSYLETILAQRHYLQDGDDDLLFLSSDDSVFETSVANIFLISHNKLYTPPTGPNVLDGTMRRRVIDMAHQFFDDCIESPITRAELKKADAVFGTNSVRGVFLVNLIDDQEWKHSDEIIQRLELMKRGLEL